MSRIASGRLKGKLVKTLPPSYKGQMLAKILRPTQAVVKKGLFSLLQNELDGRNFLDLFAGTGTVGMEAYSNGVDEVFFVEKYFQASSMIKQNLETLGIRGEVYMGDYHKALQYYKRKNMTFDVIFVDPPYSYFEGKRGEKFYLSLVETIYTGALLEKGGWLIVERERRNEVPNFEPFQKWSLKKVNEKTYGDTVLDVFRKELLADDEV